MSFRINNNIASLNTQRQLERVNRATQANMEHLSSGMRVNSAADGPAALAISENMRAQISGLNQAVENSEQGISMVQTAEGAMNEVNRMLVEMRQLAIHASNEGVNDEKMVAADQAELQNALKTIDRISTTTQFGTKLLLDGSRGANGVATGEGLSFVSAKEGTKTSPIEGYNVQIEQVATKSKMVGETELTQAMVDAGETFTISEGGKTVRFQTIQGESVESNLNQLETKINDAGLDVKLLRESDGESAVIGLEHNEYGSEHTFTASSSTAGVLSKVANVNEEAVSGQDIKGTINGEEAVGRGQVLTGKDNAPNVAGLAVRFTGDKANEDDEYAGTVTVIQNSLQFQVGANEGQTVAVSLSNIAPTSLSRGVENDSGFESLNEVDLTSFQGAQDAIKMIDSAIDSISTERGKLGAFQKNTLQSNLNNLRLAAENLTAAESTIRDTDMAAEMAQFTKHQIMQQASTAMLAQANQKDQLVLQLL